MKPEAPYHFSLDASAESRLSSAHLMHNPYQHLLTFLTLPDRNKHIRLPLFVISPGRGDRRIHAVAEAGVLHSRQTEQLDLL